VGKADEARGKEGELRAIYNGKDTTREVSSKVS
jgi:hypothetical protein